MNDIRKLLKGTQMKYLSLCLLQLLIVMPALADQKPEQWFCVEESGKRDDNVISSCGVGEGPSEGMARTDALREAFNEFKTICAYSADCDVNQVITEPKRLTCYHEKGYWKCYRLISVTLLEK